MGEGGLHSGQGLEAFPKISWEMPNRAPEPRNSPLCRERALLSKRSVLARGCAHPAGFSPDRARYPAGGREPLASPSSQLSWVKTRTGGSGAASVTSPRDTTPSPAPLPRQNPRTQLLQPVCHVDNRLESR